MNCQPISTHSTRPSSQTRFVDANWKASAALADAPFSKSDLAIATAAYEQDEEAAPRPVAQASGLGPSPDNADSMRCRGTHACTIAEIAKPSTSAHHTSHAIRKASLSATPICESTYPIASSALAKFAGDRAEQRLAPLSQRVHSHLPVLTRAHYPLRLEHLHVVGDEVLSSLGDP